MAATPRFYRKNIATGNGFLIFSVLYAVIIRIFYFINYGASAVNNGVNYLWNPLTSWFSNSYASFLGSTIIVGIVAFLVAHINNKHLLIRQKTLLPSAFIILLFSSHPSFINISGEYISTVFSVIILSMVFSAYNGDKKQHTAFQASFMLALSSLFSISAIIYLPILWMSLAIMRSFDFKAFVTSLFGIFIAYFPVFSWFLLTDQVQDFLAPVTNIITFNTLSIPLLAYNLNEWIILGCSLLLLLITMSDDYINRHKDKIKVRSYFNLLLTITFFSFITFLFLNINSHLHLFIIFITGSFLLSHFFALVEKRAGRILFYTILLIYFALSLSHFLF